MIVIGIDPGLDGAVGAISNGVALVFDTPTLTIVGRKRKRRDYNAAQMRALLETLTATKSGERGLLAALELVHSMPSQGVRSMFSMGKGLGIWIGLLAGLGIPYDLVTPQRWKKTMLDGMGKDKGASRLRAQQLFPATDLSLKKHHGRAEALLIAEYVRRTTRSEGEVTNADYGRSIEVRG